MKTYNVVISEIAGKDMENIISYMRNELKEDIVADKYKILFKQAFKNLETIAESMAVLDESLVGHKNIRKLNVKNYIIFYIQ